MIKGTARYEPRSSVRTYLYGIAFHILFAERRRSRNDGPTPDTEWLEQGTLETPDRALWVREALLKLDEGDRDILMLREYEQLSYGEIGTLLRLPVNTVRSRLFRSRLALKQLLDPSPAHDQTASVKKETRDAH